MMRVLKTEETRINTLAIIENTNQINALKQLVSLKSEIMSRNPFELPDILWDIEKCKRIQRNTPDMGAIHLLYTLCRSKFPGVSGDCDSCYSSGLWIRVMAWLGSRFRAI